MNYLKTSYLSFLMVLSFVSASSLAQNKYLKKAVELYQKKDYSGTLKQCNKALEEDDKCADCYIYKTYTYLMQKKSQEAYNTTNEGLNKVPQSGELYFLRATLIYGTDDYFASLNDVNMAIKYIKVDSFVVNAYLLRISVKMALRNNTGALDDCKEALKLDSTHIGLLTNLSLIYSEQGDMDGAIDVMKKVLTLDSTFTLGYGNIGYLYNLKENYEEALVWLNKAINSSDKSILPYALSNRAFARMKLGDPQSALKDIDESIAKMPANSYAYRTRGLIYLDLKETEKACNSFNEAVLKGFTERYGDEVKDLIKANCK